MTAPTTLAELDELTPEQERIAAVLADLDRIADIDNGWPHDPRLLALARLVPCRPCAPHPDQRGHLSMESTIPPTARLICDTRTHAAFDAGWQTLTRCGRRVTWLHGDPIDPGTGIVDCPARLAEPTGEGT